jgi:hypothetical protein
MLAVVITMCGSVHAQEKTESAYYTVVKEAVTVKLGINHISLVEALECKMIMPRKASEVRSNRYIAVVRSNPMVINDHGRGSPLFGRLVPSVTLDHGEVQEVRAEPGVRGFDLTCSPIGDFAVYIVFQNTVPEKFRVNLSYSMAEGVKSPLELLYRAWEHKIGIGARVREQKSECYDFKVEWPDGYKAICSSKGSWTGGPTEGAQSCASYGDIIRLRITRREL